MTLYPLIPVSPERFAAILKDEPKQLGKPMLKAYPAIWCPELWMEEAERWFWPDWPTPPTVKTPSHAYIEVPE